MAAEERTLEELLKEVTKEGRALTDFFNSNAYYQPSFRGFKEYPEMPEDVQSSRQKLREAAKAVCDLATGPTEHLYNLSWSYHDTSSLRWLLHFRIPEAIPLVGSISYAQVAASCDVDESHLRRIIRHAMTNRLFYEPSPEEVAHTSYSSVLVTDPVARARVETDTDELFPTSSNLIKAYEKWGGGEEPHHTAWNLRNSTDLPFFEQLAQPEFQARADRFARCMQGFHNTSAYDLAHTVNGYNWAGAKGTIVDIGGSTGETAIALAHAHAKLPQIIVQDLPHIVAGGEASIPPDLNNRIFFSSHDFFTPQPKTVLSARLFLLRFVLHDHSDKYARRIVRNLLPALRNGGTLVVVDGIMPPAGSIPSTLEKEMRNMDLDVMQLTNGKERQIEDWEELFNSVDHKLIIKNVNQPVGSALGIMEVVWDA